MTSTMCSGASTTRGFSLRRPVDEGRHAHAALVQRAFAAAQVAVGRRRLLAEPDAAALLSLLLGARARGEQRARGAAIVAGEDDQRVVAQALLLQRRDDPADLIVERGDHRGIGAPLLDPRRPAY